MMPRMRLRVVCGLGEMMANFSPTRAFSSVLLPALGRPRMQTNPEWKDMGIGYELLASGRQHPAGPSSKHMDANAEFQAFPRPVRRIDGSFQSQSQRQAGPVSQRQTEGARHGDETAGDSRLLVAEWHGLLDCAESILPRFLGVAAATHQLGMDFRQINRAAGSVAQHLRSQLLRTWLMIEDSKHSRRVQYDLVHVSRSRFAASRRSAMSSSARDTPGFTYCRIRRWARSILRVIVVIRSLSSSMRNITSSPALIPSAFR